VTPWNLGIVLETFGSLLLFLRQIRILTSTINAASNPCSVTAAPPSESLLYRFRLLAKPEAHLMSLKCCGWSGLMSSCLRNPLNPRQMLPARVRISSRRARNLRVIPTAAEARLKAGLRVQRLQLTWSRESVSLWHGAFAGELPEKFQGVPFFSYRGISSPVCRQVRACECHLNPCEDS
jgi:hypothetical protein